MNEIETHFSETLNEVLERGFVVVWDKKVLHNKKNSAD